MYINFAPQNLVASQLVQGQTERHNFTTARTLHRPTPSKQIGFLRVYL